MSNFELLMFRNSLQTINSHQNGNFSAAAINALVSSAIFSPNLSINPQYINKVIDDHNRGMVRAELTETFIALTFYRQILNVLEICCMK